MTGVMAPPDLTDDICSRVRQVNSLRAVSPAAATASTRGQVLRSWPRTGLHPRPPAVRCEEAAAVNTAARQALAPGVAGW